MIICSGQQVGKMYGGTNIFEDLQFEIHEKARVGLVGRNGSGKTTLFKLLAKADTPDSGVIHWQKGCEIGYLAQIPQFAKGTTAKDVLKTAFKDLLEIEQKMKAIELMMSNEIQTDELDRLIKEYGELQESFTNQQGYDMEANVERVANGLNIRGLLKKDFDRLSGGEKTKVSLGQLLLKKPQLLLLDEPTNHLDMSAVEWLSKFLNESDGTVVVISHDRYFLDETVNHILDLEDGELTQYHTNYSGYVKEKEERLLIEFQHYEEQQKKIKKMKETIKRLREWANQANPPNAGLHKRASSMEKALNRMEKLDRPILNRKKISMELDVSGRSGKDAVILKDVAMGFGNTVLFDNVQMHIRYQDRAVIVGDNGTGKSTLFKIILQEMKPDTGEVRIGSNRKVGYLSQHVFTHNGYEQLSVIEAFRENFSVTEGDARHILAKFLFYGHAVFRKVNQLSGGERMRLRLAQLMHEDINFLVLDEPTNHLDIESREVLEEALDDFAGTILAVSHDRYFIKRLFNKVFFIDQQKVFFFDGEFTWASQKLKEQKMLEETKQEPKARSLRERKTKEVVSVSLVEVEKDIEHVEILLKKLNGDLALETSLDRLQILYQEKEEMEQKKRKLYETWELLI
ncbi:ribosomal protection-like ABC-F family protein [Cytobacillus purgationiresistens]|uniref:ATPase subunit of ABC transporter with duplicated ATPase domains n=1 Tax=Cytobacillus purgationiresistens TaxID=863449 RepID=A0ABU0AJR1_9BACI|nr:ABC-F type ribosomal protection protein [Cytobacillus purgationiresistens]MDQ0271510.1 ATPase subunit of ABC transporter with duplicated ATPase domains [Cytobacillus purgationiresistens]